MDVDGMGGDDAIRSDATITADLEIAVTLTGNTGDDTLAGGNDSDVADGTGAGSTNKVNWSLDGVANDIVYESGVNVGDQSIGTEKVNGTPGDDTLTGSGSANTIVGASGADSILGVGGDDSLVGDSGNDTIDGGSGSDVIVGGGGADSLLGQSGNDSFDMGDGAGTETANGGSDSDSILAEDTGDTKTNIP